MTANERLRTAMGRTRTSVDELALCCGVDAKTAERWVTLGRVPHRQHRWAAASRLGADEAWLWPEAAPPREQASRSELARLYPDRGTIPRDAWQRLIGDAREEVAVLVYAALFLAEDPSLRRLLTERARDGVRVRLLLGDPDCAAVAARGEEEGIGPRAIGVKIRNVLALFAPVLAAGAEIRLHRTVLYNSLYRGDDDLLVNTHILGSVAACAPVLHLRRISGGALVAAYLECFEAVWDDAKPWAGA